MQDDFFGKHAKKIIFFSVIGMVCCILLIIFYFVGKKLGQRTYLTLQFAPSFAKIKIYGMDEEYGSGSYEIPDGKYSGVIEADGFEKKEISFEVKVHQVNTVVDYIINSDSGMKYFEKNSADINTLRQIENDENIERFFDDYNKKESIYNILPLDISWHGGYGTEEEGIMFDMEILDGRGYAECKGTLCLLVRGLRDDRERVINALAEKGYNIEDYEVFYESSR